MPALSRPFEPSAAAASMAAELWPRPAGLEVPPLSRESPSPSRDPVPGLPARSLFLSRHSRSSSPSETASASSRSSFSAPTGRPSAAIAAFASGLHAESPAPRSRPLSCRLGTNSAGRISHLRVVLIARLGYSLSMGLGRATRMVGAVVAAIALFPAQAGVAQQLPSVPSLPPTPNLPPAPPVEVPSTPSLPAPDVQVPDVQAPQLPVSPPSTPKLPSTGSATDALPSAGSPSGQSSSSGSSAGGQATVPGQTPAGGGTGSTAGRNRGSGARRGASVAPPRSPHQQRLERVVRRRSACLPGLPSAQRRVVVMRSGFGPGGPRARSDVARVLNTGIRRVARLEQQAIDSLGTDGPGGACSTAPGFVSIASGGLLGLLGLGEGLGEAGSDSDGSGGSAENAQARVAGQSETGGGSESSDGRTLQLPLGLPAASPADLGGLIVVVLLLFFAAGVGRELLSSRRTAQYH
jgi:hypothetical protein